MLLKSKKSKQRIVGEKIWEWWVYLPPISMKNCPLSSEGKFFEDHGCLFANLAAYYLGGYFEIVSGFYQFRWLPNREEFLQTLYNSRIFVLLDEVIKYFSILWRVLAILAAYHLEGYLFLGRWLIFAEKVPN